MNPTSDDIIHGNIRALARAITLVENQSPMADQLLQTLYHYAGNAQIIGITGIPGAGKSTLVSQLIKLYRDVGKRVAVIAVDPSSPFTNGAILGDRIRMLDYSTDPDVFIRSMSTRGRIGGLSLATNDTVVLLDAAGYEVVIIETVGAGQNEVDIAQNCDTTVVVTVPGLGDDIQLIKSGILEIADVLVINKKDVSGADELFSLMKQLPTSDASPVEIIMTNSLTGDGVATLFEQIEKHWSGLRQSGKLELTRAIRATKEMQQRLAEHLVKKVFQLHQSDIEALAKQMGNHNLSPRDAVTKILSLLGPDTR